jgi:hypothetical protein
MLTIYSLFLHIHLPHPVLYTIQITRLLRTYHIQYCWTMHHTDNTSQPHGTVSVLWMRHTTPLAPGSLSPRRKCGETVAPTICQTIWRHQELKPSTKVEIEGSLHFLYIKIIGHYWTWKAKAPILYDNGWMTSYFPSCSSFADDNILASNVPRYLQDSAIWPC